MPAESNHMALTWDDLSPAARATVELLREGRVTAPYVADETDYSLQYIREQLATLEDHGHAEKIYDGLYEIADDPRKDS